MGNRLTMILLDTHAWWWSISEPERLSNVAKEKIFNTQSDKRYIASISLWEFVMMAVRKRINLQMSPKEWLNYAIFDAGTKIIDLSENIALDSCMLPGEFHKDPADRIIVATAIINNALLITKDRKIIDYDYVKTLW
jgi:PIN domain nuclease of toxin-antitoxin system